MSVLSCRVLTLDWNQILGVTLNRQVKLDFRFFQFSMIRYLLISLRQILKIHAPGYCVSDLDVDCPPPTPVFLYLAVVLMSDDITRWILVIHRHHRPPTRDPSQGQPERHHLHGVVKDPCSF